MIDLDRRGQEDLVRHFIEALDAHRRHMEELLRDSWSDVDESNFSYNVTVLDIQPQSENAERIDFLFAYAGIAAGNVGLIELGTHNQLVVPAGPPGLALSGKWRLWNTDRRRISSTILTGNIPQTPGGGPAGFLFLGLWGKEIPQGKLRW